MKPDAMFGSIKIKLDDVIKSRNVSKGRLAHWAEMERGQLNTYCKGDIQRVDLSVLSRLCYALDCTVADVLEYIPPDKDAEPLKNGSVSK